MDIIFVAYNSEKWIDNCFKALADSDYGLDTVNVFVVDNCSSDDTVEELNNAKNMYGEKFHSFKIIESKENMGFGRANNYAFHMGASDIVLFLNIDTEIKEDALLNLSEDIDNSPSEVAMWELRQIPYEHPKLYDPMTREVSWCSGAAIAVRREVFDKMNGFDERIFMYAEDVDLSWRFRSFGYKLRYCPSAVITHYSYQESNEVKPNQYTNSIVNNLLLRLRFSGIRDMFAWTKVFLHILKAPNEFLGAKKALVDCLKKNIKNIFYFRFHRECVGKHPDFSPRFIGMDYETIREGAFVKVEIPSGEAKVSIIVRTCGRPSVLRETLMSLRNQTYKNIEIVLVEDGENCAEEMIEQEFSDLNIQYFATGTKVGRSKAGNLAMEKASGKYLNFLDDDDVFYADHVETLVHMLENTECRAAYATAYETAIIVKSREPYVYKIVNYNGIHKQSFNKLILCHHNYIPIQAIMFEKSLFEEYGGLDESVDALEDWDLWVRYSLHTDFAFVPKTTSLYRVPHEAAISKKRQKELDDALLVMREKHKSYIQTISVYELAKLFG